MELLTDKFIALHINVDFRTLALFMFCDWFISVEAC